jgi:mannose-6-phosphate isomerase-like protein (cupin superfamily)
MKMSNENTKAFARTGRLITGPTGQPMLVKIDGQASRGAYSLVEYIHQPHAPGPQAHVHCSHEEAFYILDGQLTLTIDGEAITLNPGEFWVVPRGGVHQPSNTSDRPVRFLGLSSPPMDELFVALSRFIADTGNLLVAGQPPTEALKQLAERYDTAFVDLPEAESIRLDNKA